MSTVFPSFIPNAPTSAQSASREQRAGNSTATENAAVIWDRVKAELASQIAPHPFSTWIKPLSVPLISSDGARVSVLAANRFKLEWIRAQYAAQIQDAYSLVCGRAMTLDVALGTVSPPARSFGPGARAVDAPGALVTTGSGEVIPDFQASRPFSFAQTDLAFAGTPGPESLGSRPPVDADAPELGAFAVGLDPNKRFESFIPGKANNLAHAAARSIASNPGGSYNPLFVYGGVGFGKTHLIHSVGHALLQDRPRARIRYMNADGFVGEFVKAVQKKALDGFKQYFQSLDLLLIDDVQFFSGKEKTQEEFFYVFETLFAKRSQIILTSDTYPKEITGIDQRLISRFDSGLTVGIDAPELELRVAILINKAEEEGIQLSQEVAFFIAQNVRQSVRDLEGALRKVAAFAKFQRNAPAVSLDMAKDALKDLLAARNRLISIENIQRTVADFYNIKMSDMHSARRPNKIARPRQIAMFLAKQLTEESYPDIGENFGGRDHTTVMHAVKKITNERDHDPELKRQLNLLEQTLRG